MGSVRYSGEERVAITYIHKRATRSTQILELGIPIAPPVLARTKCFVKSPTSSVAGGQDLTLLDHYDSGDIIFQFGTQVKVNATRFI